MGRVSERFIYPKLLFFHLVSKDYIINILGRYSSKTWVIFHGFFFCLLSVDFVLLWDQNSASSRNLL